MSFIVSGQRNTSHATANAAANSDAVVEIPHTLQTVLGMVQSNAAPHQRRLPNSVAYIEGLDNSDFVEHEAYMAKLVDLAVTYLKGPGHQVEIGLCGEKFRIIAANLVACRSNVTFNDLKYYMKSRTRLDLEQAVAVVISTLIHEGRVEDAIKLIVPIGGLLSTPAHMWIDPEVPLPVTNGPFVPPERLAKKLHLSASKASNDIPLAITYTDLVPLLMRVRRCRPDNRCLRIPAWMFEQAGITPPPYASSFFNNPYLNTRHPIAPRSHNSIILSGKHFLAVQRHINHYFRYWVPETNFRKRVRILADRIQFCGDFRFLNEMNDVGVLAYHFFNMQRRLQRKVVSTPFGHGFLAKGEGQCVYQNNFAIKSTFEMVLREIAGANPGGIPLAINENDTLARIDETCLLMKEYVDIFGGGDKSNLTFKHGVRSGSGRGPVDLYNLLCDVLVALRVNAKAEGIVDLPGHVQKFLAKDIMRWNNAWADDAFAEGREAGWESWIVGRGLRVKEES